MLSDKNVVLNELDNECKALIDMITNTKNDVTSKIENIYTKRISEAKIARKSCNNEFKKLKDINDQCIYLLKQRNTKTDTINNDLKDDLKLDNDIDNLGEIITNALDKYDHHSTYQHLYPKIYSGPTVYKNNALIAMKLMYPPKFKINEIGRFDAIVSIYTYM